MLLLQKKHTGGHLEYSESLEACAIREVHEETGVIIADGAFRAITNDTFEAEKKHSISIWMEGRYVSGEPTMQAPQEISTVSSCARISKANAVVWLAATSCES